MNRTRCKECFSKGPHMLSCAFRRGFTCNCYDGDCWVCGKASDCCDCFRCPTCMGRTVPRALSVRQPWASLIASGQKPIELRTWATSYRGPLLIVAAGKPWKGGKHGHPIGPMGVSICLVNLVDCRPFEPQMDRPSTCIPETILLPSSPHYSWVLAAPERVRQVPVSGRLNLFQPSQNLVDELDLSKRRSVQRSAA